MIRRSGSARLFPAALTLMLALMAPAVQAQTEGAAPPGDARFALPFAPDPAKRQISVKVESGLKSTRKLPTQELRNLRKEMLEGAEISPEGLRALAEFHDGLAAQRYVRYLVAQGGSDSDIAYFGSIAAATGRVWTLPETIDAMLRLNPATEPPERVKMYMAMVYPHAWAGNSLALDAVALLNGPGLLFGEMSDRTRKQLNDAMQKAGDGRLELLMAMNLMRDPDRRVRAAAEIRDYLSRATASPVPGIATTARALLGQMATGADAGDAGTALIPAAFKLEKQS